MCALHHPIDTAQCFIIHDPSTSTRYKIELRWCLDLGAASCGPGWLFWRLRKIPKYCHLRTVKHSSKTEFLSKVQTHQRCKIICISLCQKDTTTTRMEAQRYSRESKHLYTHSILMSQGGTHKRRSAGEVHQRLHLAPGTMNVVYTVAGCCLKDGGWVLFTEIVICRK